MSLRAYIATACLQGLLSQSNQDVLLGQLQAMKKLGHLTTETAFAHMACSNADALIAQLEKTPDWKPSQLHNPKAVAQLQKEEK